MKHSYRRHSGPLTVKLGELVGPLPDIRVAPAPTTANKRNPKQRRRKGPSPGNILASITRDAARLGDTKERAHIISVPPATADDHTLLFLRHGDRTAAVLAVPPEAIRSPRLRGEHGKRERNAERLFEYLRRADMQSPDHGEHI